MRSIGSSRRGIVRRLHRSRRRTVSPSSASSTAGPFVRRPEADRLRSSHERSAAAWRAAVGGKARIVEPHGTPPSIDDRRYVDGYIDDCQYVHHDALDPRDRSDVLPPVGRVAPFGDRGRAAGGGVAGHRRARQVATRQPDLCEPGRGIVRVRPDRSARPRPTHGFSSPEGAHGRGDPSSREARAMGVLPDRARAASAAARRIGSTKGRAGTLGSTGGEVMDELREEVRARYASAATAVAEGRGAASDADASGCCDPGEGLGPQLYDVLQRDQLPEDAVLASLGCGSPTMIAELHEGDTVLDLGSGGGIDVLLSAKRVGPTGLAYGLDMTDEMRDLARANASKAGTANVEFLKGLIEHVPLPDNTVDVVISNCVINLSTDKSAVIREIAREAGRAGRGLRRGRRRRADARRPSRAGSYVGCIAGALSFPEYRELL